MNFRPFYVSRYIIYVHRSIPECSKNKESYEFSEKSVDLIHVPNKRNKIRVEWIDSR